jgi:type I restriction enzyme S subunit
MRDGDLPQGWAWSTLGSLGNYQNGRGFSRAEWGTRGRPIIRIQNLTGSGAAFNYFDGELEERFKVPPGSLLVSWAATLGVYEWNGPEGALNQHIFKVDSFVDRDYHRWAIEHLLNDMRRQSHGSGMVHITKSRFDDTRVPVPPLAEQRRIVEAIETAFSKLDAGVAYLDAAKRRLDRLAQSLMWSSLLGGRAVMLGDDGLPIIPSGWSWQALGSMATIAGGVTKDSNRQDDPTFVEVPYLRVANVQRGWLDLSEITTIRVAPDKAAALRLEPNDVLFNEGGDRDKLGRGWIWEGQIDDCIHQNHVFRARLNGQDMQPKFVSWWGNTFGRNWFEKAGKQTTNLASINLTTLKTFPVPVPPTCEQVRIVDQIDVQMSLLTAARAEVDVQLRRSGALRRAVLTAAFSGKLVSQESSDESASALLERIAALRVESGPLTHKKRRRTASKGATQ